MNIGFVGYKKSGKNTAADQFTEVGKLLGKRSQELMFAERLKSSLSTACGLPRYMFEDQNVKDAPFGENVNIYYTENLLVMMCHLFNINYDGPKDFLPYMNKRANSPREIMETIATPFLRSYDKDIHVKKTIELIKNDSDIVMFTDIRFPNEFEIVSGIDSSIMVGIRNNKRSEEYEKQVLEGTAPESESYIKDLISKCDIILDNNGSLEDFQEKVRCLAKSLLKDC